MTREPLHEPGRRAIEALRRLDPPQDLLPSIMAEAEATPQARPLTMPWMRLLGTAAAAVLIAAVTSFVLPRNTQPGQTPGPGASPIRVAPARVSQLPIVGEIERQVEVDPGAYPGSADASSVWLASEMTGEVLRFDIATGQIAGRVAVAQPTDEPYDLWPISDGTSVWTSGRDDESVVRIDIASMQVADRLPVGAIPYRVAPAGSVVWVSDHDEGRVFKVRADSGEILTTTEVFRATGIAVSDTAVWVAGYRGDLVQIDPGDGQIVARHEIANNATDVHLVGNQLWISGINGRSLERFDPSRGVVAAISDEVTAVAFIDGRPWAAVTQGAVVTLDPVSLAWTGAVPLGDATMDQLVAGAGRVWSYGATGDQTVLFGVRPSAP